VRHILEDPEAERLLSVASEVEIAIKCQAGKLDLTKNDLSKICSNALISSYPVRRHHAEQLFTLPAHPKDPFDRLIISVALSEDLPIVSCDRQFRKYKGLRVIW
ncbi:MAG: type II toxin-antitoxin system VapC family toxin, partial [Bryobacteraceae bacterium]